jgi:hypothetical protein
MAVRPDVAGVSSLAQIINQLPRRVNSDLQNPAMMAPSK